MSFAEYINIVMYFHLSGSEPQVQHLLAHQVNHLAQLLPKRDT